MKKNKIAFLIAEILLCVMAIFFITKIFDQNTPEKKVAVIYQIQEIKIGRHLLKD